MAAWVASDWWAAWVADCGEYIGPWPPAPPIPANVPTGAGVDYFISAATETDVVDGDAYPAGLDVWRYDNTGSVGSGIDSRVAPISGGHLWVVFYAGTWPTTEPGFDALNLAPPLYVAGGAGTDVPDPREGHWGDSFAYPSELQSGSTESPFIRRRSGFFGTVASVPSGSAVEPAEETALASAYDDPPTSGVDDLEASLAVHVSYHSTGISNASGGSGQVDLILLDAWRYAAWDSFVPSDAIEGIDYAATPDGGAPVQAIDGSTSAFQGWAGLTVDCTTVGEEPFDAIPTLNYDAIVFQWVLIEGRTPDDEWILDGTGAQVGTIAAAYPDAGTDTISSPSIGPASADCQVTLRVDGVTAFGAPIPTPGSSIFSTDQQIQWVIRINDATATAIVDYPDLHTWIPGGPRLRTPPNPEHFRTVGGAPFKMLIPGQGWVPWRPHGSSG